MDERLVAIELLFGYLEKRIFNKFKREISNVLLQSEEPDSYNTPHVGQVVIIKDKIPRRMWKLGRIERLVSGNDRNVRTADIYLPGNRHMQHSINVLYPLELNDGQGDNSIGDKSVGNNVISQDAGHSEDKSVRSLRLPTRQAAINARHKINELWENNALTVLFTIT